MSRVSCLCRAGDLKSANPEALSTNCVETLLILLAAGAIGAIFSSTAPDMGEKGIIERYLQVRPKILFVESEVLYGGVRRDFRDKMRSVTETLQRGVSELEQVVVVRGRAWGGEKVYVLALSWISHLILTPFRTTVESFLQVEQTELVYEQVDFDHPIYILYS